MRDRVLLATLVLAALLRIPNLNESLWYDELWATRVRVGSVRAAIGTALSDLHPPFYTLISFLWMRLFGDSEISIRTIPMLSGLATIALTSAALRAPLGAPAARWAALFVALSPAHIWYSQEARAYSFLMALTLIMYIAWQRFTETGDRTASRLYFGSVLAAMLTHYYSLAFAAALMVWTGPRRQARRTIWASNLIAIASLAVFLLVRVRYGQPFVSGYLRQMSPFELWMTFTSWLPTGNSIWRVSMWLDGFGTIASQPWMLAAELLIFALTLNGAIRLARDRSRDRRQRLVYAAMSLCLPALLITLALVSPSQTYIERAMLPAMPFAFGLWAKGAVELRPRGLRTAALLASVGLQAIALIGYFSKPDEWTVYKPNPDWRAATAYLSTIALPTDRPAIVVVATPSDELLYYGEGHFRIGSKATADLHQRGWVIRQVDSLSTAKVCALLGHDWAERIVVRNQYWKGAIDDLVSRITRDCGYGLVPDHEFKGLTLARLHPRARAKDEDNHATDILTQ